MSYTHQQIQDYLIYLSKWNKSATLISLVVNKRLCDHPLEKLLEDSFFEYLDTVENFSNGDKILTLIEFCAETRDKKIDTILC